VTINELLGQSDSRGIIITPQVDSILKLPQAWMVALIPAPIASLF
jgi:hypothetical protein